MRTLALFLFAFTVSSCDSGPSRPDPQKTRKGRFHVNRVIPSITGTQVICIRSIAVSRSHIPSFFKR